MVVLRITLLVWSGMSKLRPLFPSNIAYPKGLLRELNNIIGYLRILVNLDFLRQVVRRATITAKLMELAQQLDDARINVRTS